MSTKIEVQEEFKLKDNSLEEDIAFIRSLKGCSKRKTKEVSREKRIRWAEELTEEESEMLTKEFGLKETPPEEL